MKLAEILLPPSPIAATQSSPLTTLSSLWFFETVACCEPKKGSMSHDFTLTLLVTKVPCHFPHETCGVAGDMFDAAGRKAETRGRISKCRTRVDGCGQ